MNINLLNKREAAEKYGLGYGTIYNWANAGKINKYFHKTRKTFVVSEREIQEMVAFKVS